MHPTRRVPQLAIVLALLLSPVPALAGKYLPVKGYTTTNSSDKLVVTGVAPTPDGGYVAVSTRDNTNGGGEAVTKVNSAGALEWVVDLRGAVAGPAGGAMSVGDIAVHSSGRIFVTGAISGMSSTIYLAEISSGGAFTGATYKVFPSNAAGWTLAIYGDSLYLGGSNGTNGYLEKFDISTGRVSSYNTTNGLSEPVLGIARVGSDIFVSYRDPQFFNSQGFLNKYNEPTPTSITVPAAWTSTGGGRAHVSPDGYVYVASTRSLPDAGGSSSSGNSGHIGVVSPSTGAVTMLDAQFNLQSMNSGGGECCSYISSIVDFGFLADGSMVVAYDGAVGGTVGYTSGLAGYGRQAETCGGSNCINWQFKWHQPTLTPYFPAGNSEVGSLATSGSYAIAGANSAECVDAEGGCDYLYGLVVLDNALESNPPAKGEMQVRRNVIRVDRGDSAVVVLQGDPYGSVVVSVYGPSGNLVSALHGADCSPGQGAHCEIQLDADGKGSLTFDGKYNSTTPLGSGLYWVVASGGGVYARKPVIVRVK